MFCASEEGTLLKKYLGSGESFSTTGLGETLIQSDNIGLMSLGHESGMCGYSDLFELEGWGHISVFCQCSPHSNRRIMLQSIKVQCVLHSFVIHLISELCGR